MATLTAPTSATAPQTNDAIRVRGARVHNLKNISFEIPGNALTVVTGVSGSGKSSLAFDTLYAEGQRRYIESLSAYARQFLERIERPDVDEISGISPAIAIRQRNTSRNPRSTVATATEIYDYLRLLFARAGRTYCYRCGEPVARDNVDKIADRVLAQTAGRRFLVLYPLHFPVEAPTGRKRKRAAKPAQEPVRRTLAELRKRGFDRLWQNGRIFEFTQPETLLEIDFAQPVSAVADRLSVEPESRSRLVDSIELAMREGRGEAAVQFADGAEERLGFSERFECKRCGIEYQEPEPSLFSFNSPYGACARCQGFGNTVDYDPDLIVPDKSLSLDEGAIEPWTKPRYRFPTTELRRYARAKGIPPDVPFSQLTAEQRELIFRGDPAAKFGGVQGFFRWLERKKYKLHVRVFLSRYRGYAVCPECEGARLRPEARAVKIEGRSISDIGRMSVEQARGFFDTLALGGEQAEIAQRVLEEIRKRLGFLDEVGVEYLTLDRLTSTLSGGEAQRIQLATSLGSQLVGALYVLDEPSIGLHPRDTERLIGILRSLRDLGNTIVVVEHDPETIDAADFLLDLGPGAGEHGGDKDRGRRGQTQDEPYRPHEGRTTGRRSCSARASANARDGSYLSLPRRPLWFSARQMIAMAANGRPLRPVGMSIRIPQTRATIARSCPMFMETSHASTCSVSLHSPCRMRAASVEPVVPRQREELDELVAERDLVEERRALLVLALRVRLVADGLLDLRELLVPDLRDQVLADRRSVGELRALVHPLPDLRA